VNPRSITARVLAWSLCILVLSTLASLWISGIVLTAAFDEAFSRSDAFELHQAISAYETGGRSELREYLEDLHRFEGSERYVTDGAGRDLVSGEDRSALLLGSEGRTRSFARIGMDKHAVRVASPDGRYRYIVLYQPPREFSKFAPYYLLLTAVVVLLFYAVSMQLALPLRRLAEVVRRFGSGDLAARVGVHRKDEIGEVERSFDNMADRIQTLLTAERQLLQDVSHELRSPLARLRLAAEVVAKPGDREAAALRLRRETERLSDLVNSLLQVTTAEGDPGEFSADDVNVSDILRDVVQDCQLEAEGRGCAIHVEAPDDAFAVGDSELLQRAIENVVRNAIRYSPAGSPVETNIVVEGKGLVLSVRDFGPGVPDEQLPKIFNPFFRVDGSRDASSGGIGLGLAIAQRAIRLHQGEIHATNAKPGLRVTITLPRLEDKV
jgi:signal transduction histidine kinase